MGSISECCIKAEQNNDELNHSNASSTKLSGVSYDPKKPRDGANDPNSPDRTKFDDDELEGLNNLPGLKGKRSKGTVDVLTVLVSHFDVKFNYLFFGLKFHPILNIQIYPVINKRYEPINTNIGDSSLQKMDSSFNLDSPRKERESSNLDNSNLSILTINDNNIYNNNGKRINYKKGFKINLETHQRCKIKFFIQNEVKHQTPIIIASNSLFIGDIKNGKEIVMTLFSKEIYPIGELILRFKINKTGLSDLQEEVNFGEENNEGIDYMVEEVKTQYTLPYSFLPESLSDSFVVRKLDNMKLNTKDEERTRDENCSKLIQINKVTDLNAMIETLKPNEFADILIDAIKKSQHILLYGLFNIYLVKLQYCNEGLDEKGDVVKFVKYVFEAIQNSKDNKIHAVGNFIVLSKNYVLSKTFFKMLYNILIFYKNFENLKYLSGDLIINYLDISAFLIGCLGTLHSQISISSNSKSKLSEEEMDEINLLLVWILNSLIIVTIPEVDSSNGLDIVRKCNDIKYVNSLRFLTDLKFVIELFFNIRDSDCTSLLIYLARKAFQSVLDLKNNYLNSKKNNTIAANSIRQFLIDQEKSGGFLMFIQMCLIQYFHYPELFSNLLIICISLVSEQNNNIQKRKVIDILKICTLCKSMHSYIGKYKNIGRHINKLFLEYLTHVTELSKAGMSGQGEVCLKNIENNLIAEELNQLFKTNYNEKEKKFHHSDRLNIFLAKRDKELMVLIISITTNITKNKDASVLVAVENSYLIPSLIEYVFCINKDLIKNEIHKTPKHEWDKLFNQYLSIIDGTAVIFDNLICRGRLTKDYFMWVLNLFVISKNKIKFHYKELLQISIDHLNDESQKLRASINNLLVNLERD